jgi:predicted O-methyltransferase YrrM
MEVHATVPRAMGSTATGEVVLRHPERLRAIALARWRLLGMRPWSVRVPRDEGFHTVELTGWSLVRATSNATQGRWLAELAVLAGARAGGPVQALELGSSVGVSGMYLLAGLAEAGGGRLVTFEGSADLAGRAHDNCAWLLRRFGIQGVSFDVVVGAFQETYAKFLAETRPRLDLVFIDGHHQEEPTLRYHEWVQPFLAPRAIVVHDDVAHNVGMVRAWRTLREKERDHRIVELCLGGRPTRGVIFRGDPPTGREERVHLDGLAARWLRRARDVARGR